MAGPHFPLPPPAPGEPDSWRRGAAALMGGHSPGAAKHTLIPRDPSGRERPFRVRDGWGEGRGGREEKGRFLSSAGL